ncbi:VOC family protein [Burkholderia vietnamiensis]|uniref:VOC family protein n=1 Tax=Burkholderia vietnamiensis TaxID=60552 RepID=UPI002651F5CE|nr:VOC family protein [Burkholderia vietnamiensis]MDN7408001.1 VOC family protein [Burkholderia vietnamiensis]
MFNIFCLDVDKQFEFYAAISGWREIKEASSPIYRVLVCENTQLGFNGLPAYDLLGLEQRKRTQQAGNVNGMVTFVVESPNLVDDVAELVPKIGGKVVKVPFATYYAHWQLVFEDPEGNIARVTSTTLPGGAVVPAVSFT